MIELMNVISEYNTIINFPYLLLIIVIIFITISLLILIIYKKSKLYFYPSVFIVLIGSLLFYANIMENNQSKLDNMMKESNYLLQKIYAESDTYEITAKNLYIDLYSFKKEDLNTDLDITNSILKNKILFRGNNYLITKVNSKGLYGIINMYLDIDNKSYNLKLLLEIKESKEDYAYLTFETNEESSYVFNGKLYLPKKEFGKINK